MKKAYKKPTVVAIVLDLDEHITTGSGVPAGNCGWNWSNYTSSEENCISGKYGSAVT